MSDAPTLSEPTGNSLAAEQARNIANLPETVAVVPYASDAPEPALAAAETLLAPPKQVAALAAAPAREVVAEPMVVASATPSATPLPEVQPASYVKPGNAAVGLLPKAGSSSDLDRLMAKYAAIYELPVDLVRRVVKRESNFNPRARNKIYWGLMQIRHDTARGMGYDGPADGLLDAETNLKYAVKYLRGAFLVSGGNHERADRLYQRGYYYDAKRMGLLDETGLGRDRVRRRAG